MKKKVLIIITALAALLLSACSDIPATTASQVENEISSTESTIMTESTAESGTESTSLFEQVNVPSGEYERMSEEQHIESNTPAGTQSESAQSQAQQPIAVQEPEQTQQTVISTEPTTLQSALEQSATPQTPEPPPESTPEPTPEPAQSSFDVGTYVSYAKSYGQGIGLTLDSSAVSCWDDPITADASCIYLERDIRDRLNWYQASGYSAFWVWSADNGGGNYQIYIGYA